MSTEAQRVVVIQDASRNVSAGAIGWVLQGLSLKHGDVLTLLGVLHQVNNPSTFSFKGAGRMCKDLYFHFFYALDRRISTRSSTIYLKITEAETYASVVQLKASLTSWHWLLFFFFFFFFSLSLPPYSPPFSVGYKINVDSSSMFGANPKLVAEAVSRKIEEYQNNKEIMKIAKQCETEQVRR
ncbi:uncharacterized protein LOC120005034 [Tripterygium wilfordii]|uniref:uncharacterized protein LOC120005034 n=1 Tax=Tripterygium wilfordii TaxID=458696 RepID=UPI0018F8483F|nr:uncharacterized protein LOC120005034 [Tripterygium wilfordii]